MLLQLPQLVTHKGLLTHGAIGAGSSNSIGAPSAPPTETLKGAFRMALTETSLYFFRGNKGWMAASRYVTTSDLHTVACNSNTARVGNATVPPGNVVDPWPIRYGRKPNGCGTFLTMLLVPRI